jgi:dephospho-CoA kinase
MIKIGILGDIGSGKSYVAQKFGYPVFNADQEVAKLYKQNKNVYFNLKNTLPKYIYSFPIEKIEISNAILGNKYNLNKIVKIVNIEIRKKMNTFFKKYKNNKFVILDIPLLLENKINTKDDLLIYVQSKKSKVLERLKKRKNFNQILLDKFKTIQLPIIYKKKKSDYIIKNDFTKKSVKDAIESILTKII